MRCLQHVLWRGALALGLLVSGGTGAMLIPQPEAPACAAARHDPQPADWRRATATRSTAPAVRVVRTSASTGQAPTVQHSTC